jgi:hypothetical protein
LPESDRLQQAHQNRNRKRRCGRQAGRRRKEVRVRGQAGGGEVSSAGAACRRAACRDPRRRQRAQVASGVHLVEMSGVAACQSSRALAWRAHAALCLLIPPKVSTSAAGRLRDLMKCSSSIARDTTCIALRAATNVPPGRATMADPERLAAAVANSGWEPVRSAAHTPHTAAQ